MSDVSVAISLLGYNGSDLTETQAKNVLALLNNDGKFTVSQGSLRELVNKVSTAGSGDLTVLYGVLLMVYLLVK